MVLKVGWVTLIHVTLILYLCLLSYPRNALVMGMAGSKRENRNMEGLLSPRLRPGTVISISLYQPKQAGLTPELSSRKVSSADSESD